MQLRYPPSAFRFPFLAGALALLTALPACDSGSKNRMPSQPANIQPSRVGVWATPPLDTDANGYVDTVEITVYVSADQHPVPLSVPGTFTFRLIGRDKKDLATWHIDEPAAQAAMRRSRVGPGYFFTLNVKDVATDEIDAQSAELAAEFTPRTGKPVQAPLTGLRFGRTRPK
ncbi:MAG TPA: hypothetical protein VD997_00710 [Phycisphaerales bacterium]|nr:hypothetical protein [Phycisphaerales bacterium]